MREIIHRAYLMEGLPNPVPDLARIQPGLSPRFREPGTNSARGSNGIQRGLNLDLTWTSLD